MGDGGQSTMVVRRRQRQCVVLAWGRCGLTRKVRLELCSREVQQCMLEAREREKEQLKAGIQGNERLGSPLTDAENAVEEHALGDRRCGAL